MSICCLLLRSCLLVRLHTFLQNCLPRYITCICLGHFIVCLLVCAFLQACLLPTPGWPSWCSQHCSLWASWSPSCMERSCSQVRAQQLHGWLLWGGGGTTCCCGVSNSIVRFLVGLMVTILHGAELFTGELLDIHIAGSCWCCVSCFCTLQHLRCPVPCGAHGEKHSQVSCWSSSSCHNSNSSSSCRSGCSGQHQLLLLCQLLLEPSTVASAVSCSLWGSWSPSCAARSYSQVQRHTMQTQQQ